MEQASQLIRADSTSAAPVTKETLSNLKGDLKLEVKRTTILNNISWRIRTSCPRSSMGAFARSNSTNRTIAGLDKSA